MSITFAFPLLCYVVTVCLLVLTSSVDGQFTPYSSAPVMLYTFDSPPIFPPPLNGSPFPTDTNFGWTPRLTGPQANLGHGGLASFNGVNNMINMNRFADSQNRTFNFVYGGSGIAVEYWIYYNSPTASARLADISNGYYINNVFNFVNTANDLAWRVFYGATEVKYDIAASGNTSPIVEAQWIHTFCQVIPYSTTRGNMTCYVNGVQGISTTGKFVDTGLPDALVRTQAFFGQIALPSTTVPAVTANFDGVLDLLAFYNTSLPNEAVAAHSLVLTSANL